MTTTTRTISSQRYLDHDIVADKIAEGDYTVSYVTVTVDGEDYDVVIDGHHRLAAAQQTGAEVVWLRDTDVQQDVDAIDAVDWLEQNRNDSDWYDISTTQNVW